MDQSEQGVALSQWTRVRTTPARRPDGSIVYVKASNVIAGLEPDPDPTEQADPAASGLNPDDLSGQTDSQIDAQLEASTDPVVARSFTHSGEVLVPSGAKSRARANLAAIEVVAACSGPIPRPATAQEQDVLAQWSGWGAIPEIFDDTRPEWAAEHEQLRGLLTDAEYREARASTLNAHYTDPAIASAMWSALTDAGFDGGYVLEPGCGSGNFIGLAPESATMIGVELDPMTAQIAHLLYPDAQVRNEGFEQTRIPEGTFSAVIGNVPFGGFEVPDPVHNPRGRSIHNHFLLKSLALTAPGGYVLAITSAGTLDATDSAARRDMHEMADLVGAVRLPGSAFTRVAGTQVVTDVLVFRKRDPATLPPTQLPGWLDTAMTEVRNLESDDPYATSLVEVNEYFLAHPDRVLGEMSVGHGLYRGGSMRVDSSASATDLHSAVRVALRDIVEGAAEKSLGYAPEPVDLSDEVVLDAGVATAHALYGAEVPIGRVWWDAEAGQFVQKGISGAEPIRVPQTRVTETRHLLRLRDEVEQVIASQREDGVSAGERSSLRDRLNHTYDAYVAAYGPVNRVKWTGGKERTEAQAMAKLGELEAKWRVANADADGVAFEGEIPDRAMDDLEEQAWQASPRVKRQTHLEAVRTDPGMAGVLALEHYDEETGKVTKAAVFSRDVVSAPRPATSADSPEEAVAICLGETGHIALDRIGGLLDQSAEQARESVRGLVFRDVHNPDVLLPASTALSGNVRAKHEVAVRQSAEHPDDTEWSEVAHALAEVIPETKQPTQMGPVKIGATWIAHGDYEQFVREVFGARDVTVQRGAGVWVVDVPPYQQNTPLMRNDYGAEHGKNSEKSLTAVELFERLLNQRSVVIKNTPGEQERGAPEVDTQGSIYAQVQSEKIADEFRDWLWRDDDRRERLVTEWNTRFNTWVTPQHDGSRLQLPGLSAVFDPHPYQRDAVARIVAEPTVLLDHVVGAGKTGSMFMGAMELHRRGLVSQPWIVVPTHLIEQFGRELPQWYPAARVLVGSKGMSPEDRRVFAAQTATSEWDIVIVPDSVFERIGVHPQRRADYITAQVDELDDELRRGRNNGDLKQTTVKKIERAKKQLAKKLDKALAAAKKDAGVTFEQTGCDYLFIDEAHYYKNKTRTCAIDSLSLPNGANKAEDLSMKLDYLRERRQQQAAAAGRSITPGAERVATFSTGTPIANSLAEAWVMQNYLRPDVLEQAGVRTVTDWAASFTASKSETVTNATGTKIMVVSKVSAFSNPREMFQMSAQYTDVVTRDQVPANLPEFGERRVIRSTPGQERRDFITDLEHRLSHLDPKQPQRDNVLKVMSDGRNVAIDPMLAGLAPDPGNTRADAVAAQVSRIYHETKDNVYRGEDGTPSPTPGGLQLVFCDLGTPKPGKRSVYDNLKALLVEQGVPEDKVAFIHDAKSPSQKLALQAKCRSGQIAVLIGSTPKMGTGLNVQQRMVALHHMDVPWRPADLEQREGRIIRQGNQNARVEICTYVTEGTTDTVMWATVESKAAFIQQAKTGQLAVDMTEVADVADDDLAAAAAATKAAATGDPRYMRMAELDSEVASLQALAGAHADSRRHARSQIEMCLRETAKIEQSLPTAQEWADTVVPWEERGKPFRVIGKTSDVRAERSALLLERARACMVHLKGRGAGESATLAEFDTGVVARCSRSNLSDELYVWLDVPGRPQFYLTHENLWGRPDAARAGKEPTQTASSMAAGITTRLENAYTHLSSAPERMLRRLAELRTEIEVQTPRADAAFGRAEEFAALKTELHSLRLEIESAENSDEAIAARAESAIRMAAKGRTPGWSLELNPTQATVESEGFIDREDFVRSIVRMHHRRAIEWAEEHPTQAVALAGARTTRVHSDFPAPARAAVRTGGSATSPDTRSRPSADRARGARERDEQTER